MSQIQASNDVLVITFPNGGSIAQVTDRDHVCDLIENLCSIMEPNRLAVAEFSVAPNTALRDA